ncbi:glycerophosphodiester phosphodiesterase family protein [Psychroflexus planctonicus]|uniref:Glycerophosphoryl diester phosphodiesterase n=1 Tax=Psychroflexus planctonicus TaxID=1526575 RepID=A0ABQ1SNG5_9FLAO|nr:glycerophosphodiester phosphodiesterase family protein [Psychroflexus planctonicus]GGE43340.1 glycerophosphoryl diester phosphodiesterase [Psychroflexus planctonicus]
MKISKYFNPIFMFALTLVNQKTEYTKEKPTTFPSMNKFDFEIFGHRGARGLAPENTLAAFEKAIELGVNALEMDVVITKDEKVLVSHEAWMNPRICTYKKQEIEINQGKKYNIFQMTYAKTQDFDCGKRLHPNFEEQENEAATKPLLKDVLQMGYALSKNHGIPLKFVIEIKSFPEGDGIFHPEPKKFVDLVLKVINKHAKLKDVCLQSFDVRILNAIHLKNPKTQVALLTAEDKLEDLLPKLDFMPAVFSPHYKLVTKMLVMEAQQLEMKIIPWTVNEPEDMQKLLRLGVDGIITDYPNRALKFKQKK